MKDCRGYDYTSWLMKIGLPSGSAIMKLASPEAFDELRGLEPFDGTQGLELVETAALVGFVRELEPFNNVAGNGDGKRSLFRPAPSEPAEVVLTQEKWEQFNCDYRAEFDFCRILQSDYFDAPAVWPTRQICHRRRRARWSIASAR